MDTPINQSKTSSLKGYLCVLGGVLAHLMIGNLYLWGNITEYVVSYFHYLGDTRATPQNAVIIIPLSFTI
jgi:hypothetical protein